jgi:hypothetical protein
MEAGEQIRTQSPVLGLVSVLFLVLALYVTLIKTKNLTIM